MSVRAEGCVRAQWNLSQLLRRMPVYSADDGSIYCGSTRTVMSLHSAWYTGPRRGVDDEFRPAEIEHWREMASLQCEGLDTVALTAERLRQNQRLWCARLRYEPSRLNTPPGGRPSDRTPELSELIERECPPER